MQDLDELRARAEELGIKVDGRWGFSKLCQVISDAEGAADGLATSADHAAAYPSEDATLSDSDILDVADAAAADVAAEMQPAEAEPVDDGWPKRIAPCAWLDQDGNRHTDMGLAHEAADRIRGRT